MVSVPGFLLRRLYVKQSLRNTPSGFEFQLKNGLGSGHAHRVLPMALDGQEIATASSAFVLEGRETRFDQVGKDQPFTLALNKAITVRVDGLTLEPGPRRIAMGFEVPGLGALRFDFTDTPADG